MARPTASPTASARTLLRATVMTASATHNAALKLRAKALDIAAELMQAPPDMLDILDGKVVRKDAPRGPSMTLGEIADHLARDPRRRSAGARARALEVEGWFRVRHQVYPGTPSISRW